MTTKIAVVGVGALGQHHARILSEMDGVELIGVVDSRVDQGQLIAERLGTRCIETIDEASSLVDCVSIAVPTQYHRNVAEQFLANKIPVMVEKPLAGDVADAQFLVDLAAENSTLLQVGHIERYNPARQAAWARIDQPRYVRCERVSPFTFRSIDIGVVHDLMIHDIDLLLDLVQAPVIDVEAFGVAVMGRHEDAVQARIRFRNGCIADVVASRISPTAHRTMQAWSQSGCTTVDFTSREVQHFGMGTQLQAGVSPVERAMMPGADINAMKAAVFGSTIEIETVEGAETDALTAELAEFVSCVTTGNSPMVDGEAALEAMKVAERVLESVDCHQWDASPQGRVGADLLRWSPQRMAG